MRYRVFLIDLPFAVILMFLLPNFCVAQVSRPSTSSLQAKLTSFEKLANSPKVFDDGDYDLVGRTYDRLLSAYQNQRKIKTVDDEELRLLFRAAYETAFYTSQSRYVDDMRSDLAEMEHRHLAAKPDYQDMYEALTGVRMFAAAREFYGAHRDMGFMPLPAYVDETARNPEHKATALTLSATGWAMTRRAVDLDGPSRIVILTDPFCHFAKNFTTALKAHPEIGKALRGRSIWLAPPNSVLQFATLQKWNLTHPSEQIQIMFQAKEWPMVTIIQTPTFYFLKDGRLVATVVGWPESGNFKALQTSLKKIGLLREK